MIEPVGGAAPKFSSSSKSIGTFEEKGGEPLALVCPAQAHPLPSFRYKEWVHTIFVWTQTLILEIRKGLEFVC